MKTKALYQMTLEELREQEQFYCNRTSHSDLLMLSYIREAIAAKAPTKTHTDAISLRNGVPQLKPAPEHKCFSDMRTWADSKRHCQACGAVMPSQAGKR